jgi:hypothetical protein
MTAALNNLRTVTTGKGSTVKNKAGILVQLQEELL